MFSKPLALGQEQEWGEKGASSFPPSIHTCALGPQRLGISTGLDQTLTHYFWLFFEVIGVLFSLVFVFVLSCFTLFLGNREGMKDLRVQMSIIK